MTDTSIGWALLSAYIVTELFTRGAVVRRLTREIVRLFVVFELQCLRFVRWVYPPRYVLLGGCHKCGQCCRQILGDPPDWVKKSWVLRLFVSYHRVAHNFHAVARGPEGEVLFACGYLGDNGHCGIYRLRPFLCRNYPLIPFFEPPRPLAGCGFSVAARVVVHMQARGSLPILNPFVAVHHPTPMDRDSEAMPDHFHLVSEWHSPDDGGDAGVDPSPGTSQRP